MTKRDKLFAARIPKETDVAIKTLLKKDQYKHSNYSDIVNLALEKFLNSNMLDGDFVPPAYGTKKLRKS